MVAQTTPINPETNLTPDVHKRIGELTRVLHDALQQLGYHKPIEQSLGALPDARSRLGRTASQRGARKASIQACWAAGLSSTPISATASASESPTGTSRPAAPSASTRRNASRSLATTGVPAAIASTSTIPKLSPPRLGAQYTSALRSADAFSASST